METAMTDPTDPRLNGLLAALPADDLARWRPHLQPVDLQPGRVLYESGQAMHHLVFPTTAIVSLHYVMEDGASAEIAVVGHEGVVGVSLFMGGDSMPNRAVVQGGGQAWRLPRHVVQRDFEHTGPVVHLLLRYTQALITQMAQTAVCNRHHSIEQQLCRWLLKCLDRVHDNEIVMTQESIAHTLCVRREGVTAAATRLQQAGLIRYRRGHIMALDRAGLEARVCECYAVVRNEYARLLPPLPVRHPRAPAQAERQPAWA